MVVAGHIQKIIVCYDLMIMLDGKSILLRLLSSEDSNLPRLGLSGYFGLNIHLYFAVICHHQTKYTT